MLNRSEALSSRLREVPRPSCSSSGPKSLGLPGRAGGLESAAGLRVREAKAFCLKPGPEEASGQVDVKG